MFKKTLIAGGKYKDSKSVQVLPEFIFQKFWKKGLLVNITHFDYQFFH